MQPATRAHRLTLAAALSLLLPLLVVLAAHGALPAASAAEPGLPFTEDFTTTDLRDAAFTNADWSTLKGALQLTETAPTQDPFGPTTPGIPLSEDDYHSTSVVLGDVNGDNYLDIVISNCYGPNRLYLNTGSPTEPFAGVTGLDISDDWDPTRAIALGDVDGDGDLDLVVGNTKDPENPQNTDPYYTRVYFNNGNLLDPFGDAVGRDIQVALFDTKAVALRDMDGDGDLDLVLAAFEERTWLYLNNGTDDPFSDVGGRAVSVDIDQTKAMVVGDVNGDSHLDVVVGNEGSPNRLFLNNGTDDPFAGAVAITITLDADPTRALALGDIDSDDDLDLIAGNDTADGVVYPNKLYLNNGTDDPFSGTVGISITADADPTWAVALGDVDSDGDLDLVTGNYNDPEGYADKLYLNNGTADPFSGTVGISVSTYTSSTKGLALGDLDWDGDLDLVAAHFNFGEPNMLYLNQTRSHYFLFLPLVSSDE